MEDPLIKAEEIVSGTHVLNEYGLEMHFEAMAWSYPKYDDFIIFEYTFKNTGSHQISNFRFAPTAELAIAQPIMGGWRDDNDYEWDIDHQAFYFHDGREWDIDQQEYVSYDFGLTGSDLGDPADIDAPASINHEFQSPQYFTYYWLDKPTKSDPSEPDHMNIVDKGNLNQQWNRAQPDPLNDNPEVDFDSDDYILVALTYDQPPPPETEDGIPIPGGRPPSDQEHQPDYIYSTGPYDIPPGAVRLNLLCSPSSPANPNRWHEFTYTIFAAGGDKNSVASHSRRLS